MEFPLTEENSGNRGRARAGPTLATRAEPLLVEAWEAGEAAVAEGERRLLGTGDDDVAGVELHPASNTATETIANTISRHPDTTSPSRSTALLALMACPRLGCLR